MNFEKQTMAKEKHPIVFIYQIPFRYSPVSAGEYSVMCLSQSYARENLQWIIVSVTLTIVMNASK